MELYQEDLNQSRPSKPMCWLEMRLLLEIIYTLASNKYSVDEPERPVIRRGMYTLRPIVHTNVSEQPNLLLLSLNSIPSFSFSTNVARNKAPNSNTHLSPLTSVTIPESQGNNTKHIQAIQQSYIR
jgi:hypothetical protein